MKRIVEETLQNGEKQYRCQSNRRFFGLIIGDWYTMTTHYYFGGSEEITCNAVFSTLEEAQRFLGINPNPVVKKEVIVLYEKGNC